MAYSATSDRERARMDELEQKYEEERRKRKEEQGASGGGPVEALRVRETLLKAPRRRTPVSKFETTKQAKANFALKDEQKDREYRAANAARRPKQEESRGQTSIVENEMIASRSTNSFDSFVGEKLGEEVWRIANESPDELFIIPQAAQGIFRECDCYIVLHNEIQTVQEGERETLKHTLYLWCGKSTTAQSKAREWTEKLQKQLSIREYHSVNQGEESEAFSSLFGKSLKYIQPKELKRQIGHRYEERPRKLYQIGGDKRFLMKQVEVSPHSLNLNDTFILDDEAVIYQWSGIKSSRMKIGRALDIVTRMRDERMTRIKAETEIFNKREPASFEFWKAIGGKIDVEKEFTNEELSQWECTTLENTRLYLVYETEVSEVPRSENSMVEKSMLQSDKCFVLDSFTELYVWFGKFASPNSRRKATEHANSLLTNEEDRPKWVKISEMHENAESILFTCKFTGTWTEFYDTPEKYQNRQSIVSLNKGVVGHMEQKKVNVDKMHNPLKYKPTSEEIPLTIPFHSKEQPSNLMIWYVTQHQKIELPAEEWGIFCSNNCYLVQYSLTLKSGERKSVLYYWQGNDAHREDRGASAMLTKELADTLKEQSNQIRVLQGKEPDHFLSHFVNKMVILIGHRDSLNDRSETFMIQIQGNSEISVKGSEVNAVASSLNSADSFVVFSPPKSTSARHYIWHGKGSNSFERSMCKSLVDLLSTFYRSESTNVREIDEGDELQTFWRLLNGQSNYADFTSLSKGNVTVKLFHFTEASGIFTVDEIEQLPFTQSDLKFDPQSQDGTYILDAREQCFVWSAPKASKKKIEACIETAKEYVACSDDGRKKCPIYVVESGKEPLEFTAHFHGWYSQSREIKTLSQLEKFEVEITGPIAIDTPPSSPLHSNTSGSSSASFLKKREVKQQKVEEVVEENDPEDEGTTIAYDLLTERPLPVQVPDPTKLEGYLSHKEFRKVFKMSKKQFYELPAWKQLQLRKEKKLF